jgi:IS5 family transposase
VVLRDEGARGRGQQDEDHPLGGGDGGQHGGFGGAGRSSARGEETKVWGDQAYRGQGETIHEVAPKAQDLTHQSYRYKDRVDEVERAKNRTKSKVRSKVEHVFAVIKLKFGYVKVRYRGIQKNATQVFTLCALTNLFRSRRRLLCTPTP